MYIILSISLDSLRYIDSLPSSVYDLPLVFPLLPRCFSISFSSLPSSLSLCAHNAQERAARPNISAIKASSYQSFLPLTCLVVMHMELYVSYNSLIIQKRMTLLDCLMQLHSPVEMEWGCTFYDRHLPFRCWVGISP